MQQEQKEMQEFSSLMKSMLRDNKDKITDRQDRIAQVHHTSSHMLVTCSSSKLQHLCCKAPKTDHVTAMYYLSPGRQAD